MNSLKYIVTRLLKGAGKSDHENIMTRLDELEKIESQAPHAAAMNEEKRIKEINEVYESIQKRRPSGHPATAESRPNARRITKSSFLNKALDAWYHLLLLNKRKNIPDKSKKTNASNKINKI